MQQPSILAGLRSAMLLSAVLINSAPALALAESPCDGFTQLECHSFASRKVFALLGNNVIAQVYGSKVVHQAHINNVDGTLIGLDFRPSESNGVHTDTVGLYAMSDTGKIYTVLLGDGGTNREATLVSEGAPRFDAGTHSLLDFNPVANALRLIGGNHQNFALVNSNGNLNGTVQQTDVAYAAGDPSAGQAPNLTGGAYDNNVTGATRTIFYMLDHARDTLVTIADQPNGNSATGSGRLKTIGRIVDAQGAPVDITPEAGLDIYTDSALGNAALIANGRTLYFVNLSTVNAARPVGKTQTVVAKQLNADDARSVQLNLAELGAFLDIAATPAAVLANPAD